MNWARALWSRANAPFINVKRAPLIFAAVSKSSKPRPAPRTAMILCREIELAWLALPAHLDVVVSDCSRGHARVRMFGIVSRQSGQLRLDGRPDQPRTSSIRRRQPSSPPSRLNYFHLSASIPRSASTSVLRFDCRSCVRTCAFLRCSSRVRIAATSIVRPRVASAPPPHRDHFESVEYPASNPHKLFGHRGFFTIPP